MMVILYHKILTVDNWVTTMIAHCNSEDPAMTVAEITPTQRRNLRSKTDKTYHLVVSFPPRERPTDEQLRYIEDELCAAIGLLFEQSSTASIDPCGVARVKSV
jgi:hypothetical protein